MVAQRRATRNAPNESADRVGSFKEANENNNIAKTEKNKIMFKTSRHNQAHKINKPIKRTLACGESQKTIIPRNAFSLTASADCHRTKRRRPEDATPCGHREYTWLISNWARF